eukprot:CAMPEP_0118636156 /NCGR_PEP_ID=MMETSP0785-20121206/2462_1 /TAXON_ID=91992 /ORGANISM="Bolidomonas pacifica, Strain CCMP 1866" /LENGTH=2563 /DNA_ID=CAMNT_0006527243 /DNA_START=9 /DNA_END=7697 /DNA_ORIENTATION=-
MPPSLLPHPRLLLVFLLLLLLLHTARTDRTVNVNCLSRPDESDCSNNWGVDNNDVSRCCDPKAAVDSLDDTFGSDKVIFILRRGYIYSLSAMGKSNQIRSENAYFDIEVSGTGGADNVALYNEAFEERNTDDPYYTTIDGANFGDDLRAFNYKSSGEMLTLRNLKFRDFKGGAFKAESVTDVRILGCHFHDNGASSSSLAGAAIYFKSSGELELTRVRFTENRSNKGGAVYVESSSKVTANRVSLASNRANYVGGIYMKSTSNIRMGDVYLSTTDPSGSSESYNKEDGNFGSFFNDADWRKSTDWSSIELDADEIDDQNLFSGIACLSSTIRYTGPWCLQATSGYRAIGLISSSAQKLYTPTSSDCNDMRDVLQYKPDDYSARSCTASPFSTDDGTGDGAYYCINWGVVGGTVGSCTCTNCGAGYSGTSCATADPCTSSTDPSDDGLDGVYYCLRGDIGGTTGACTCTNCEAGYTGSNCDVADICSSSTNPEHDGSDGNFYCINGGIVGGTTGSCTCTDCNDGYSGDSCMNADPCVATKDPTDDGSDGNFYCINDGTVGGTTGSCTCTDCRVGFGGNSCESDLAPTFMGELHNLVSNYVCAACRVGTNLMAPGDIVVLSQTDYSCATDGSDCAHIESMLSTKDLGGTIVCEVNRGGCVLDGAETRRMMYIDGKYLSAGSSTKMTLRALTFHKGIATIGGGIKLVNGALVEVALCTFQSCKATKMSRGGGAIFVSTSVLDVVATAFNGNEAMSGNGDDIYDLQDSTTITVKSTCPEPSTTFTISTERMARDNCVKYCESKGGSLACINNESENTEILTLLDAKMDLATCGEKDDCSAWIGYSAAMPGRSGGWEGTCASSFTYWNTNSIGGDSNEPNGGGLATMYMTGLEGKVAGSWNDVPESSSLPLLVRSDHFRPLADPFILWATSVAHLSNDMLESSSLSCACSGIEEEEEVVTTYSWKTLGPHTIDSASLDPGVTYKYRLKLKNYLRDGFRSVFKEVSVSEREVPQVRIVGPPSTETTRDKGKRITAEADFPVFCGSSDVGGTDLSYTWTVTPSVEFTWFGGGEIVIEGGKFTAGVTYHVTVQVDDENGGSNTATQVINVLECPLVAMIDPLYLSTSTVNEITLSTTSSFDPDGDSGIWSYLWEGEGVNEENNGQATLTLLAGDVTEGEHLYTCIVTRNNYEVSKSANASATVVVEKAIEVDASDSLPPPLYPVVVIDRVAYSKVNMGTEPLSLPGRLQEEDFRLLPITYSWDIFPREENKIYFAASSTAAITAINLGEMREDQKYIFSLTATDTFGRRSTSSVAIEVNTPPSNGMLEAMPTTGTALETIFGLKAEGWTDEDLPLEYVFRQVHKVPSTSEVTNDTPLTGRMAENNFDTMLSSGEEAGSWKTWVKVEVLDSLGAKTSKETHVAVKLMEEGAMSKMRELVKEAKLTKDGTGIAKFVESGARSVQGKILEGDTLEMMNAVEKALSIVGGEEGVSRIIGTIEVVSARGEGDEGMKKGFELTKRIIENVDEIGDEVISSVVGTVNNTLDYKLGGSGSRDDDEQSRANETEVYDVLRNIGGRLTVDYAPGLKARVAEKGKIKITANSFVVKGENKIDGGDGASWNFKGERGDDSDGLKTIFRTSAINIRREAWKNWTSGKLVSDVVSLAVWKPKSGRIGWEGGLEIEIPISAGAVDPEEDLNNTKSGCDVFVGGVWRDDLCVVKEGNGTTVREALDSGRVVCVCKRDAVEMGGKEGGRRLSLDDNLFVDIGNAFVRAGWVLRENNSFDNLSQQLGILIVLGSIYVIYIYVILRSQINDWKNVKERHKELLKTDFVEKAIRAMRENFVRIQLSHKDSVVGELERMSSEGPFGSSDEGKTTGGLDAFTNRMPRSVSEKHRLMSQNLLRRNSSLSSIDDEDDADILNFLSTREGDTENQENSSDDKNTTPSSRGSFTEVAEKQALLAQESKLHAFKSRKMEQFWKGLKKEHEILVAFGRRGSMMHKGLSTRSLIPKSPGPTGEGGGMFAKEVNHANTHASKTTTSTAVSSNRSSETDGQLMKFANSRAVQGVVGETLREEKIQELEEFVSTAHKSTVFLTQLLSFLFMAVFFYEKEESMFSEERWNEITTANNGQAAYLVVEELMEGLIQVLLTVPITFTMVAIFKQLDSAGTARVLFEMRVATDQAKLLHGIAQTNPVDLRRSIHEVEGLLRIINEKSSKRKQDVMVVKYTLNLLKSQLKNVRAHQKEENRKALEKKIIKFRSDAKNFKDMAGFRRIKALHKVEIKRRMEVEDVLVKLCSLDSLHQALFLKDRRAMNHMKGRFAPFKRYLYKNFIAEKEGFVPDQIGRFKVVAMELIAAVYVLFLTYFLFKHSIKYGQLTTLRAIGSFTVELILSAIIVSPFFIFCKYIVIPYFVAMIVEDDVKKAAVDYGKTRAFKRKQTKMGVRERMNSIAKSMENGMTRIGRAMSGKTRGSEVSQRLSIDNGDGSRRRDKSFVYGMSSGSLEEGGRVSRGGLTTSQVEMIDMRLKEGREESKRKSFGGLSLISDNDDDRDREMSSVGVRGSVKSSASLNPMRMLTA